MKGRGIIVCIVILCFFQVFLASCNDDDLKKAAALSGKEFTTSDRSFGVELVYSDSAVVKAKGFAPILDKVSPKAGKQYQEMPKGVKIDFYDQTLKKTGSITSNYAIMKETEQLTIFKKHVAVVNDNLTFNTEELTWDQQKKMFFSPKGVVVKPDGSTFNAVNFSAPQDFSYIITDIGNGETYIKGDLAQ
jgi:endo-1,4-beta-D-glucanase Y